MFQWASEQIDKLSQTVAPPPTDAAGRFGYAITRLDENTAMGCIAEIDPVRTVVNQTKGWFPIHMACQYSMVRLIRLLMNQPGVSIQQPDYAGLTPLHHACMSTQRSTGLEVVKLLINEYSADPCVKNSQGQTPYEVATLDSIRQYLLPIQLQRETQYALDNGGQGLMPGIDLGGLKINRSNMAPPPKFGGAGVAAPPPGSAAAPMMSTPGQSRYPQTPGTAPTLGSPVATTGGPSIGGAPPPAYGAAPVQQPQPVQHPIPTAQPIARAPASMPGRSSARSQSAGGSSNYSRSGGSSLAVYSKYKADGFHSSSSDVKLQQKYGHVGANSASAVPPPPSSGNAPVSGGAAVTPGPNPFSGAANLGGVSRYASYGQTTAPAPVSGPMYGGMGFPPAGTAAPKFFTPVATNSATPTQTTSTTPSSLSDPISPHMPPPPYSGMKSEKTDVPALGMAATAPTPSVNSPFATPHSAASTPAASNLFESPPKEFKTTEAVSGTTTPATSIVTADESKQQTDSETKEDQTSTTTGEENISNDTVDEWVETTDPTSGKTYYFNSKTNETSWEKPNLTTVSEETTTTPSAAPEQDVNGGSDWSEIVDPSSGNSYYYNSKTGETSWEKPSDGADAQTATTAADNETSQDNQWVEATDPNSGNTYYYNSVTGETSWDRPPELDTEEKSSSPNNEKPPENTESDANATDRDIHDNALAGQSEEKAEDEKSPAADSSTETVRKETNSSVIVDEKQSESVEEKPSTNEVATKGEDETPIQTETVQDTNAMETDTNAETISSEMSSNALPDGWEEVTDPTSGKIYFCNMDTQETSWDRPVADSVVVDSSTETVSKETNSSVIVDEKQSESVEEKFSTNEVATRGEDGTPAQNETVEDTNGMETDTNAETISSEMSSNALPDGWEEVTDPTSGKIYFCNMNTQETSWERPVANDEASGKPVVDTSNENIDTKGNEESVESLAGGWEEVRDPATGKSYYFNKETQETSWEKPVSTSTESASAHNTASNHQENDWVETLDASSGKNYYYNSKTGETSWEMPSDFKMQEDMPETTASETQTMDVSPGAESTGAQDPLAQPTVDANYVELNDDKPKSSPLAGGHERTLSAEDIFASPPGEIQSAKFDNPDVFSPTGATERSAVPSTTTAADLFGASAVEPTPAKIPESTETSTKDKLAPESLHDDVNESEDGVMTDIPLTPDPVSLIKAPDQLSNNSNTTGTPSAPVAANDLFAAIGMPPPPFQSKR